MVHNRRTDENVVKRLFRRCISDFREIHALLSEVSVRFFGGIFNYKRNFVKRVDDIAIFIYFSPVDTFGFE